ncbi:MAG: BatD family protein [Gemmatimonadota bacterium]|nr:BatD family protein [Gemmatimonadota bacterium]
MGKPTFAIWILLTVSLLCVRTQSIAQEFTFDASVDETQIGLNQDLTLQLTVSGNDIDNVPEPNLPELPDFLIMGRTSSTSSNISIINGKITSSRTIQYIHRLRPRNTGQLTIGAATINHNGNTYRTRPITIDVSDSAPAPSANFPMNPRGLPPGSVPSTPDEAIMGDDLFLRSHVSKRQVYIGEQVTITYKLFTRVGLSNVQYDRLPSYTGFLSEELFTAERLEYNQEILNGKRYNTVVIKQVSLFPTIAGEHKIDPYSVFCHVPVNRRNSLLDSFFDDPFSDSFFSRSEPITLKTQPASIEVKPLPAEGRPEQFSGGVGRFTLTDSIDESDATVNQPFTLTVKLSGEGNLKTVDEPILPDFRDFKRYASSSNDNIKDRNGRVGGDKTYSYVLIPLQAGALEIAPVTFSYFDPEDETYHTLITEPIPLQVAPGEDGESSVAYTTAKEEVRQLRKDIQYIKASGIKLVQQGELLYLSPWFFIFNALPITTLVGVFVYKTHSARLRQDVGYARWRRAHSETRRALQAAEQALQDESFEGAYTHIATALQQYIGDKFNVTTAGLTSQQVIDLLREKEIEPETINSLKHSLEACDMARFAPTMLTPESTRSVLDSAKRVTDTLEQRLVKRS